MSTKQTIKYRERKPGLPGIHLYSDMLDEDEPAPVYLTLDGVNIEACMSGAGGACVTIELPAETAVALGLIKG